MANDPFFSDIRLTRRAFEQMTSDRELVDLMASASGDLQTINGRANLAQAIINRLLTRQGELARLGHPTYGSRLHQLIGELNNARVRALAEIYIRECLAQEARIEQVTEVTFAVPTRGYDRSTLQVTITVEPVGGAELTLTLPLQLGGGG